MYPRANKFPQSIFLTTKKRCAQESMVPPDGRAPAKALAPSRGAPHGHDQTPGGYFPLCFLRVAAAATRAKHTLATLPRTWYKSFERSSSHTILDEGT